MADGGGTGQFGDEVKQAVAEVAKDVKDSVGEMIEQGVQSVAGPTLTPQQIQQKQLADQKKLAETRRQIAFLKKIDEEQKQVRAVNKQKESQRLQAQANTSEVNQGATQRTSEVRKAKKPGLPEEVLRTQIEIKAGKGVGG